MEGGRYPAELIEADLWERFGWTPMELDEQDEARGLPAVAAVNVRDALGRVSAWLETKGKGAKPTEMDWEVYAWAQKTVNSG